MRRGGREEEEEREGGGNCEVERERVGGEKMRETNQVLSNATYNVSHPPSTHTQKKEQPF